MSDERYSLMHLLHELETTSNSVICVLGRVARKLRGQFSSLMQLEGFRCSFVNWEGIEEDGFFCEHLKDMILKSCGEEDIEIFRQFSNINAYSRDRTIEQQLTITSYRRIKRKIQQRYNRIIETAYGNKCIGCTSADKKSLVMNCDCESSICKDCINNGKRLISETVYKFDCPNCRSEATTFINVFSRIHSLNSLFNIQLQDPVQDPVQVHKRQRTVSATVFPPVSVPVSIPVSVPVSATVSIPVSVPVSADRKSTRLNSSHALTSRMPSSA